MKPTLPGARPSRRRLRQLAGLGTAATVGGGSMLAALAAGGDSADTSGDVAEIGRFGDQLPSHQPLEYATADLAVPPPAAPGFTSYPSDAVRAIENPPGRGGPPIGITTVKWGPIPPGAGRNAYLDTIWRRKP